MLSFVNYLMNISLDWPGSIVFMNQYERLFVNSQLPRMRLLGQEQMFDKIIKRVYWQCHVAFAFYIQVNSFKGDNQNNIEYCIFYSNKFSSCVPEL
jgi:hypothetical protein